ncbi:MAG: hypothetical protein FWC50_04925 [Planctomycetaceae bacterium]|nr:hypothetical protein [Planctomycetaceae bacterium]
MKSYLKLARSFFLIFVILTLFSTLVFGQVSIKAPSETLAGDLVIIMVDDQASDIRHQALDSASNANPEARSMKPDTSYAWSVTPPELVEGKYWVGDEGRTVTFASRLPGTYYFSVAAVVDGKVQIVTHKLDNMLPAPQPAPLPPGPVPQPVPPTPEPTPQPQPDINAEISALKEFSKTKATELVKSQYFDREKKALAEAFLTTAKLIEDGKVEKGEQARTKQRENSRNYLASVSLTSWKAWDAWDKELSKRLAELDAEHTLTVEQIGKAYKAIGMGLQ